MRIIKHSSSCCQIINYVNIIWPLGVSAFNISGIWLESGIYSETLNNEYIERIYQMSYSSLSDNGMLQIYSFLIKWLYGTL